MNKVLAWFITFNFINITWVFFRAKDFDIAMKVLGSMFSLDNIALSQKTIDKFEFLKYIGIKGNNAFINIGGSSKEIALWFFVAFVLVIFFKNSMELATKLKLNILTLLFIIVFLNISFFIMEQSVISEFLYFNF